MRIEILPVVDVVDWWDKGRDGVRRRTRLGEEREDSSGNEGSVSQSRVTGSSTTYEIASSEARHAR
jgi:hypothetical protein